MRDLGWFPSSMARRFEPIVRRRSYRMLQLAAVGFFVLLGYTVVNEFVWKGQHSARTLDFGKAVWVLASNKQTPLEKQAASLFLMERVLKALRGMKRLDGRLPGKPTEVLHGILRKVATEVEGYR